MPSSSLQAWRWGSGTPLFERSLSPDLTTTVLTLTITGLAADSSFAGGSNPRWQRRVMSVLLMFAGALVGALLLRHSLALPLGAATGLTVCGMVALYGNPRL